MTPSAELESLASRIRSAADGLVLVVTGAGVSLASGIPTFRGADPGAIWARDVTELGTFHYFREDPVGSWRWYLHRFNKVRGAQPNAAHTACVALERWQVAQGGDFLLVTQNIDTLHRQAGTERLIEVHGRADRARCSREGCDLGAPHGSMAQRSLDLARFESDPSPTTVPRCPKCQSLVRQHVLWFDEYYSSHQDYQFDRVINAGELCEILVFVGTSFSVGVTELLLRAGLVRNVPMFSIDPSGTVPTQRMIGIPEPAERALPALVTLLDPS
jgi:NAD-dependent SIR2 family protein deacetylase